MAVAGSTPGRAWIGTSGWIYRHWVDRFYPKTVPATGRFGYYASHFGTVEINGSFYRLPSEAAVSVWAAQAPPGFIYAWKASRYITHAKVLKDVGDSVALVFGRMAGLGAALGPALFQLPPRLRMDVDRLANFLALLPKGRRIALEFRHPSWYEPVVLDLLTQNDIALCVSDHHHAPAPWVATASFAYVRGHGPGGRYVGRYDSAELDHWAGRIADWLGEGRDVYAYFDNDIDVAAPGDACALKAALEGLAGKERGRVGL